LYHREVVTSETARVADTEESVEPASFYGWVSVS